MKIEEGHAALMLYRGRNIGPIDPIGGNLEAESPWGRCAQLKPPVTHFPMRDGGLNGQPELDNRTRFACANGGSPIRDDFYAIFDSQQSGSDFPINTVRRGQNVAAIRKQSGYECAIGIAESLEGVAGQKLYG